MTEQNGKPSLETLRSLLERLEKAEGPDREVDIEIEDALVDKADHLYSHAGGKSPEVVSTRIVQSYTVSLDAAIALVEKMRPGWFYSVAICYMSAHGYLGVDYNGPHRKRLFREFPVEKYDEGFQAELTPGDDISTGCRVLLHMLVQSFIAETEK